MKKNILRSVILAFILVVALAAAVVVIPSGYVGVHARFGKVMPEEMMPGVHLIIPGVDEVYQMSVRTLKYDLVGPNSVKSLSKDGLTIDLDVTVLYKLNPDKAAETYVEYGPQYEDRIIKPVVRAAVRDVIAQLESSRVYQERDLVQNKLYEQIKRKLAQYNILLDDILVRAIRLPQKVVEAIEQKRRALEEAERMRYVVDREKLEAERKRIEAEGIAAANKVIARSLTREYLMWKFIQNLEAYAKGDNNTVVLLPYDKSVAPIISLPAP